MEGTIQDDWHSMAVIRKSIIDQRASSVIVTEEMEMGQCHNLSRAFVE